MIWLFVLVIVFIILIAWGSTSSYYKVIIRGRCWVVWYCKGFWNMECIEICYSEEEAERKIKEHVHQLKLEKQTKTLYYDFNGDRIH